MTRLGILISGRGSNLRALLEAAARGELGAEAAVVVSNVAAAPGLAHAAAFGVPQVTVPHDGLAREEHEGAVLRVLSEHGVGLLCLAGYMRLLSGAFVRRLPGRILNVHPSLLPAFPGRDAVRQAWSHGVKVTGATVHIVDETLDGGPIILQEAVPVLDTDGVDELAARTLAAEHRVYPRAVRLLASGRVRLEGRRVRAEAPCR